MYRVYALQKSGQYVQCQRINAYLDFYLKILTKNLLILRIL